MVAYIGAMRTESGLLTLMLVLLLMFSSLSLASTSAAASATRSSDSVMTDTGELIIGFKGDATPELQEAIAATYGYTVLERNDALNCILVQPATAGVTRAKTAVSSEEIVRYVEPNKRVHALYTPNDTEYLSQWALPSIKVDRAWDRERGTKTVTIAILDSGIDYTHEDLSANYLPGGYDWVNSDTDPMDDFGHGTQCAGIAAAVIDNGKGIAGIAQVNLLAEKVLDHTGWGTEWDVAQAIVHAADHNATVISLSFGGNESDQVEEDACRYAWDNGCLLVAAAGNAQKYELYYPAAYESVIGVGSIDQNDQRRGTWGPHLELVAPGVSIISTTLNGGYASGSGTSMATPHVAGVAALMWSNDPSLTNQQVRTILTQTTDDLGAAGFDEYFGYGKINAQDALLVNLAFDTMHPEEPYPSIPGIHTGTITPQETIMVSKLSTYPCPGTGGHTAYARIWRKDSFNVTASWKGYQGDWQTISFEQVFLLEAGKTYNYTIETASYPQIHHNATLTTPAGTITCTSFTDHNGRVHPDWIPAIRLFL
jgi:subtilisin family serine protease